MWVGAIHRVIPAERQGLIWWFHGNSGSSKTRLAISFDVPNKIVLDADDVRKVWTDLGFSKEDRITQNMRLARLAQLLSIQGYNVCVASICPYAELRRAIKNVCPTVTWVYVSGPGSKEPSEEYPFEEGGWID
jgi:adenylylsulfate kinase-like enzyme